MRIFVAGATGVLGRRVVPSLVGSGHEVRAVARTEEKAAALSVQGATPVAVDLFDAGAVRDAVAGCQVVLNLATAIPPTNRMAWPSAWEPTARLRSEVSHHLVDAAIGTDAARYVQEALGFVYPDRGSAWIDEDTPLEPPDFARTVLDAEAEVRRFDATGATGVALRFGLFYSADSPQTRDLLAIARRGWMAVPGRPDAYLPWVHVDDAGAAVVAALDVPGGAYNVVEDDPLTNAEHDRVLGELFGRRVRRPPAWMAVGPLRLQTRSERVSNARLRRVTGWRPALGSRREGLPKVAADLRSGTTAP